MSAWLFWLSISVVMLIGELLTGILFFLCLSIAALLTIVVSGVLPMDVQGIVFAILSAIFLYIWARWRKKKRLAAKSVVTEPQHYLIDRDLVLSAALEPEAQIQVADGFWFARTEDGQSLAIGTKVKVVAMDGTTLIVRAI